MRGMGTTIHARTILVLGGGVGGLTVANDLRRRLRTEHSVVLLDKRGEHLFSPSLLADGGSSPTEPADKRPAYDGASEQSGRVVGSQLA